MRIKYVSHGLNSLHVKKEKEPFFLCDFLFEKNFCYVLQNCYAD